MLVLSESETRNWWRRSCPIDGAGLPADIASERAAVVRIPREFTRVFWFSTRIAEWMSPFDECVLWVTQTGVWPSSENWHLFYAIRQHYGERRLLYDAPGHLFLAHEKHELASCIQIAILAGWDCDIGTTGSDSTQAFVSHDEWVGLRGSEQHTIEGIVQEAGAAGLSASIRQAG